MKNIRTRITISLVLCAFAFLMTIGGDISEVEVLNISPHGFWLMVSGCEHFLDFDLFPRFRQATVEQLCDVELWHGDHLYWPKLDADLNLDRILHPEKHRLVAKQTQCGETSFQSRLTAARRAALQL